MKTFAQLREETSSYDQHKKRVQNIQKGSEVSFTSAKTGKKVTGTYKGLKQMGGRSYAHVEHGDGSTYVPVHQIHESTQMIGEATADDHKKRVQKITKGSQVSFTHATSGKKISGTYQGIKRMGGRSYAHVEHKDGATYVPFRDIHESLNENHKDRHSDESSNFAHMISHVAPHDRKKYVSRFHRHMADFHVAHGNDDDERMNDSLDAVNNVNSELYRDSKVDYLMNTDLGRLIDHKPGIGFDLHRGIIDAALENDHDALNKHIHNLHAYIKQYNI
jgi:hypothetical protein